MASRVETTAFTAMGRRDATYITSDHPDPYPAWRLADMALQRGLGLLPRGRRRAAARDRDCPGDSRCLVTPPRSRDRHGPATNSSLSPGIKRDGGPSFFGGADDARCSIYRFCRGHPRLLCSRGLRYFPRASQRASTLGREPLDRQRRSLGARLSVHLNEAASPRVVRCRRRVSPIINHDGSTLAARRVLLRRGSPPCRPPVSPIIARYAPPAHMRGRFVRPRHDGSCSSRWDRSRPAAAACRRCPIRSTICRAPSAISSPAM